MTPTYKIWLVTLVIALSIGGCAYEDGPPYSYKAESAIGEDVTPATVTNTAGSPAEMGVGDVYTVTFDQENPGLIDFEGTDSESEFILAVASIDTTDTSHTVQILDESAPEDFAADAAAAPDESDEWKYWGAREAFDQQMRGYEMELSKSYLTTAPVKSMAKALFASESLALGDTRSFKVLSSLSSLSSYKTVEAEVKCIGEHVIFYVDLQVAQNNPQDLTDEDIKILCADFDVAAGMEIEMFGEPSDINGDGKFAALLTPQVNRLGYMGGGIITGFFFANDLYMSSNSNMMEIIYTMVPDSKGIYGMAIPKSFAMDNLLPAVLPHELQHAINYADGSSEENWLNEALSHLSEDLVGFGQENPSRVEVYLNNTSLYGPIARGSPGLAERGASYLFLRYLYEQAQDGNQFVWDLLHSELSGVENLEAAFNGNEEDFDQVAEFLMRWNTTLVMSSFNLSMDPRFSYKERAWNEETNHWEGACLSCETDDGRGTILTGLSLSSFGITKIDIEPTAAEFYQITSFPIEIDLKPTTQGTYAATLVRFK